MTYRLYIRLLGTSFLQLLQFRIYLILHRIFNKKETGKVKMVLNVSATVEQEASSILQTSI